MRLKQKQVAAGHARSPKQGFTLVELVIVVVIIGIISAIAVSRIAHAGASAEERALEADLRVLREAIDIYAVEHRGEYPTSLTALMRYTSADGGIMVAKKTPVYNLGPYIRVIPPCPTGSHKGATAWAATGNNPPGAESPAAHVGWLYHSASGNVWVNDTDHLDK